MRRRSEQGYSLLELLIVIGLLALVAAIAAPALNGPDETTLDRAAAEVAAALRFAQAEAKRTSQAYGVIGDTAASTLKVYRLDDSVNPPVVAYDIYDPFTKQLYTLTLKATDGDLSLTSATFTYENVGSALTFVGFAGETGVPKYNDSGTLRLLSNGYFRVELDGLARSITVAPITGRVTIQ